MFPTIDKRKTGINIRRIMDEQNVTVKMVQEYLGLGSVQSVYHWLNGLSMPTVDNLYALSELFQVPMDEIVCGNRRVPVKDNPVLLCEYRNRRMELYYTRLHEKKAS